MEDAGEAWGASPAWARDKLNLHFEEEGHCYTMTVPGVVEFVGPPTEHGRSLAFAFPEEARRTEVISTTTIIKKFTGGKTWFTPSKAQAGTDRHRICELNDRGAEIHLDWEDQVKLTMTHEETMEVLECPVNDNTIKALGAWRQFLSTFQVSSQVAIELPVVHAVCLQDPDHPVDPAELGRAKIGIDGFQFYAGTIDRVLKMPGADGTGSRTVLVDIKGPAKLDHYPIQLAAYQMAWNANVPKEFQAEEAWCVHLNTRNGGSFEVVAYSEFEMDRARKVFTEMVDLYGRRDKYDLGRLSE